jgi:hypothetical protein
MQGVEETSTSLHSQRLLFRLLELVHGKKPTKPLFLSEDLLIKKVS